MANRLRPNTLWRALHLSLWKAHKIGRYYRAVNFRPTTPTYRVVGRARSGGRRHNRNPPEGRIFFPLEGAHNWVILSRGIFRPTPSTYRVFRRARYGGSRHPQNPLEGMRSYPLEGAQRRATLQCSRKRTHHTDIQWVCTVNRHKTLTITRAPSMYRYAETVHIVAFNIFL